ncbi:MAG TPA: beta-L-arabinofuranosidase domain-containing protein [Flavitalea sp.]|nr:beta-L-arabinofuranosidase domain-containing protein [Flavitalea sp.]
MKLSYLILIGCIISSIQLTGQVNKNIDRNSTVYYNRAPLRQNPYQEVPLGAIRPQGWLLEMLERQRTGATGNLDKLYPLVMNQRNGWLGGDGDQWERGPYWIDGLLPLAYILHDKELISKVKPWIEWAINSQQPDGYFGPSKDYPGEKGLQRNNSHDWWPKMVMLKVLRQYYSATGDKRIINMLTSYFRYQLKTLPAKPLDHWSFWARYRGCDNLMIVYWLYNITGDKFLLELGDLIHKQTFDYTNAFLNTDLLSSQGSIHAVNLAQGFKAPLIYYQHHPEKKYMDASKKGLKDLIRYNGMAHGLYGGDEALHGNNPTQGSELCSAVEMMFSLENMLQISGDVTYADQLEKIAFNALPAQTSDDYMGRQYFQQANQVMISRHIRNFDVNHSGTDLCYGLLSGYPCCTSNMHQGWPKFTQNLWYTTADKGVAALIYAPSDLKIVLANGTELVIKEETSYPFGDKIRFVIDLPKTSKTAAFPYHLRIPSWCREGNVQLNGKQWEKGKGNQIIILDTAWNSGDIVELILPMHIYKNTWYENSRSIERGPLVYALKIGESIKPVVNEKDPVEYGTTYNEIHPTTPWNYGLPNIKDKDLERYFVVSEKSALSGFPWNEENAPVSIKTKGRRIPSWQLYNEMTGPVPYSITYGLEADKTEEEIILIPYGCTQLRISQFPVIGR